MNIPALLLIDKPKGISSFAVIRELRKKTGIRKFGHAGTLDPLATGLMLIGVETGTKLLTNLVGLDKEYEAQILIGERRSTGDMEGEILEEKTYTSNLTESEVEKNLISLDGETLLPVSAYSAIKKAGKPMYKRARAAAKKGVVLNDIPQRLMKVHQAELLAFKPFTFQNKKRLLLTVRFSVGSGTYIRSLAEELGRRLSYPATLYDLRRTKVGEHDIKQAKTLDDIN